MEGSTKISELAKKKEDIASKRWEIQPRREEEGLLRAMVTGGPEWWPRSRGTPSSRRVFSRKNLMEFSVPLHILAGDFRQLREFGVNLV